jgi:anti-sigma factor RsiW
MTTNTVSCEYFSDRLMAYLEHETDDATRAALERHAVTCAECGAVLADLRKLRVDAANLPELAPARDLWAGISARIEAPVVAIGTRQAEQRQSPVVRRWTRVALIAASLIAAAGVGYFAAVRRTPDLSPALTITQVPETLAPALVAPDSSSPLATPEPRAQSSQPRAVNVSNPGGVTGPTEEQRAVATLSADYDREMARLRILINQRRNQLDPVTVAIIEKNLQVIDTAIAECKKAIARDPASRFLIESLNQSLQSKVELMRTAALLPSRT